MFRLKVLSTSSLICLKELSVHIGGLLWTKIRCGKIILNLFTPENIAEDRVLCLSLVAQTGKSYILKYFRDSKAQTDVPDTISGLMTQRRRWINGSWFALIDTVYHCSKICKSGHSKCRKIALSMQMLNYILNLIFNWFLEGLFCLAFCLTFFKNFEGQNASIATVLIVFYIALLLAILIVSLSVNPNQIEDFFKAIAGFYQVGIIILTLKFMLAMDYSLYSPYSIFSVLAATILAFVVVINCEIVTLAKGVLDYILLIPTYVNIFSIYSICNLHDCFWGNRPDKMTVDEENQIKEFQKFRTYILIPWVLSNTGVTYIIYWVFKMDNGARFWIITIVTATGIGIIFLRGLFGLIFLLDNKLESEIIKTEENKVGQHDKKDKYWELK